MQLIFTTRKQNCFQNFTPRIFRTCVHTIHKIKPFRNFPQIFQHFRFSWCVLLRKEPLLAEGGAGAARSWTGLARSGGSLLQFTSTTVSKTWLVVHVTLSWKIITALGGQSSRRCRLMLSSFLTWQIGCASRTNLDWSPVKQRAREDENNADSGFFLTGASPLLYFVFPIITTHGRVNCSRVAATCAQEFVHDRTNHALTVLCTARLCRLLVSYSPVQQTLY